MSGDENLKDNTTPEVERSWGGPESAAVMQERLEMTVWEMRNVEDWGQEHQKAMEDRARDNVEGWERGL